MTNSFKRFLQKCISLYYITLLATQSLLAPITLLIPQTAYAVDTEITVAAPTDATLSYDSETHEFTLTGNSEEEQAFILTYQTEAVKKAVSGDVSAGDFEVTELAGSCSTGTCVYDEPTGGQVMFPDSDFSFSFTISDDSTWLEISGGWQVGPVEQDYTYQAPQNNDVQITFTELPENPGYILIKEVELSPEQVEELGAYSNIAYDITSNMENGTFTYDLSLPKPSEANENTRVVYAETPEELAAAQEIPVLLDHDSADATNVNHFTIFVVTKNPGADCGSVYTAGSCYETIQAAIDDPSTLNGDTIEVYPGIYNEFTVTKELTIEAQSDPFGADPVTIVPSSSTVSSLINIVVDNVIVSGFKVDGTGTIFTGNHVAGIRANTDVNNAPLANIQIVNNFVTQLSINNPDRRSVQGIHLYTDQGTSRLISNVLVSGNTVSNIHSSNRGSYGIQLVDDMAGITIVDNTISGITSGGWSTGIAVDAHGRTPLISTDVTIEGNTVTDAQVGIYAEGATYGSQIEIHENNIFDNTAGVVNVGPEQIDARNNWWGSYSGPQDLLGGDGSNPDTNPDGTGNAVVGNVWYGDWAAGNGSLTIRKLVCAEGIILSNTSFKTATDSATYTNSQIYPNAAGEILVNGNRVAIIDLDESSFPDCYFAPDYNFAVSAHPEDTSGAGGPTGPTIPFGTITSDSTGTATASGLIDTGRLEIYEVDEENAPVSNDNILGFACARNGQGTSNLSNYGEYATFNSESEAYCVAFNTPETWTVSGLKYEDRNGNAVQDESETGLEGWTIKAVDPTPVDIVTVDSGDMAGTDSVTLPAGDYLFIAEGTWNNAGGTYRQNDAEYRSTNGWTTNVDGPNGDLMVGNSFVEWGPYSDQHTYYLNHTVETVGAVNFSVFDGTGTTKNAGWYGDNSGDLTVTIYKVYDEMETDANGEYELTIPSTANEVHLYELMQGGWEQTSPASSDHLVATPSDEDTTNYNFGNRLIPELSTITMCKEDGYGEPLEGWTLGLATVTGSELAVPVDGSAVTSQNLPAGDVVVFADGYYNYARTTSWQADAGYSYRVPPHNPISDQPGWVSGEELGTPSALEMKINNTNINWMPYAPDHSYLTLITGFGGGTMTAGNIYDSNYSDNTNTGNFRARFESVVAQGRTDERGCVTFSDVEQGSYTAFELPQEGWEFVAAEQDGDEVGTRHPVDVEIDSAETTIVMTNQPIQEYVTLEGYKFDDTNNNGQYDTDERYLNNWNIRLFDENWASVEVAITGDGDTDGMYQMLNIEPDQQYYVCEVEKNAWMQTYPSTATGVEHPRNGSYCHAITPKRGETITDLNFGNYKLGVLQGRKYEDTQANGEHDGSLTERFLGGWTINLYQDVEGDWQLLDSMVTENSNSNTNPDHNSGSVGNGQFRFKNLLPGTYYVCEETQDNWEQTGPPLGSNPVNPSDNVVNDAVAVANESDNRGEGGSCWMTELETSGEKYTQLKFGNFAAGTIGGYKWNDEDQDGIWDGIENSDATESALLDWTIFIDENDNQTLDASESATTTSVTGEYAFTNLEMDTYSICEVQQSGWTQTYPSDSTCHTVEVDSSSFISLNNNFGNYQADDEEVPTPTVLVSSSSSSSSSGGSGGSTPYQCNDTKPSSAPTLSVVATGPNSVQLSWNAVSPVSHYAVFFTDQNGQEYGASNIGNTTTYAVTNLNGNNTYSFQVLGVNGCAPGDRSNTATLTEPLIGGAVIGNPIGENNQVLGVTDGDDEEDFSDSTGTGGVNPEETSGEVLGEETAVCSQWTIWLPILLLALQAIILLILELVIREPSMNKYLVAVVATIGTLIAAYLLKECNCESVTTVFTLICEWYWILALTILALMRGAGMLFLETEES